MTAAQVSSKSMATKFFNGKPDGVRKCTMRSSTITAYIVPRELLGEAKRLNNNLNYGIYYLVSKKSGCTKPMLYVGQTTQGFSRMDDHKARKDFWDTAIIFLASRENFTLEILNGLEKYAIQQAKALKRYSCTNVDDPHYSATDDEQTDVEDFYEEICFYMAAFGYPLTDEGLDEADETNAPNGVLEESHELTPVVEETLNSSGTFAAYDNVGDLEDSSYPPEVKCHAEHPKRGVSADAIFYPSTCELKVLEGSLVDLSMEPKSKTGKTTRQKLLDSGNLVPTSDNSELYVLKTAVKCSSATDAAEFVFGNSRDGPQEWKDDNKKSLKVLFPNLYPD